MDSKPATVGKSKARRAIGVSLAIVVLIVVLVLLLPTLVSLGPVRTTLLNRVGKASGCTLSAESCSLSWFGSQRIARLTYDKPNETKVTVREITISAGLARLLSRRLNLGTIEVVSPDVVMTMPAQETGAGRPSGKGPAARPARRPPPEAGQPAEMAPLSVDLSAKLIIKDGKATITAPGVKKPVCIKDLNASAEIASLSEPISFNASLAQADAPGTMKVAGSARPLKDGLFRPDEFTGEISVDIADVDLSPAGPLAAAFGGPPEIAGRLNVKLKGNMAGMDRLDANGHVEISGLTMTGGPLAGDKPSFEKTGLHFDLEMTNNLLSIGCIQLVSPPVNAKITGLLRIETGKKFPAGSLMADASLELPVLAAAFPQTLRLNKGLTVSSGVVALNLQTQSSTDELKFISVLESRDIKVEQDRRPIALDPFHLSAKGAVSGKDFVLDDLKLTCPFASATGAGNMANMKVDASVDLGKARTEIQKIVDLGNLSAAGTATASIRMNTESEKTRKLSATLNGANLAIGGLTPKPFKQDAVEANTECLLNLDERLSVRGISGLIASLKSSLLAADLGVRELSLPAGGGTPAVAGLTFRARADLQAVDTFCREAGLPVTNMHVTGSAAVNGEGSVQNQILTVSSFSADISDFAMAAGGSKAVPAEIHVKGAAEVDLKNQKTTVRGLTGAVKSPALSAELGARQISVLQGRPWPEVAGLSFKAESDLQALRTFCKNSGLLTNDLEMAGQCTLSGEASLENGILSVRSAAADASGFVVAVTDKKLAPSDIHLKTAAAVDLAKRQVTVNGLIVNSPFAKLELAEVSLKDWRDILAGIACRGSLSSDLGAAMKQLGGFSPLAKGSSLAGKLTADLNLAPDSAGGAGVKLNANLGGFEVVSAKGNKFTDNRMDARIEAALAPAATNLTLKTVKIGSTLVNLACAGGLSDLKNARDLDVRGSLEVDFSRVAELIVALSGTKMEIEGKQPCDFHLRTSLADPSWPAMLKRAEALAGLYIKRFKFMGIETGELAPALTVTNAQARLKMSAVVNKGMFSAEPIVSAGEDPAILSFPENSQILRDVELSQEMVSELLTRVNPIFSGCSVLSGRIGMTLANIRVPLAANQMTNMTFAGDFDPKGVKLAQGGIIKDIVELAKLDTSGQLVIPDQKITFTCKNGRIDTSPLVINVGKDPITVSGYMTVDGTLHYKAEFPVTERLVGKKSYPKVKGANITLPIEGTVANPKPMSEAVTAAVEKLVADVGANVLIEEGVKALDKLFAPPKKDKKK